MARKVWTTRLVLLLFALVPGRMSFAASSQPPPPPNPLTVSNITTSQIKLSWDSVGGASSYTIERSLSPSLSGLTNAATGLSGSPYLDTGLASSTTYYYRVKALKNKEAVFSDVVPATTLNAPPSVSITSPTSGTTYSTAQTVSLTATATDDAGVTKVEFYDGGVLRGTDSIAPYTYSWGITSAANGAHTWTAKAYDGGGLSRLSSAVTLTINISTADTTAPSVPTGLTAAAVSCSQINLTWNASTDNTGGSGVAFYRIYRNGVPWVDITATAFNNSGLSASTSYSFSVAAYDNAVNVSAPSAAVSATTPTCSDKTPPSIPTGLTALAASCTQVNLTWNASTDNTGGSGVAGYRLYRNGTQIAQTTSTAFNASGQSGSAFYSFTVAAYDYAGYSSAQSAAATVTTPACTSQSPVARAGPDQTITLGSAVTLSGSASYDPDGFIVSYAWDFRDGTTGSGVSVTHTYAAAGTYWVTLTVTDNSGLRATDTAYVDVLVAPPSPGAVRWSRNFGGTGSDSVRAAAVDSYGNVVLTGSFQNTVNFGGGPLTSAGSGDIFLVKYAADGTHVWSKRFGGIDHESCQAVAVDPNGDVLITGQFQGTINLGGAPLTSAGSYDIYLAKFSGTDGLPMWSERFGGTAADNGYSVAVDAGGSVVLTGSFQYAISFGGTTATLYSAYESDDTFLAKFRPDGTALWSENFWSTSVDRGLKVAVDGSGNLVIMGYFLGQVDFGGGTLSSADLRTYDIFLAKFTSGGTYLWQRRLGGLLNDYGNGMDVDGSGNVVVTGNFTGTADFGKGPLTTAGADDVFVVKYSAAGQPLWSKRLGGSGYDKGVSIAAGSDDNVLVTGFFQNAVDFGAGSLTTAGAEDIFVAEYASDGMPLWTRRFGGSSSDLGYAVVAGSTNAIAAGDFQGTADFGKGPQTSAGLGDVIILSLWP